MLSAVGLAVAAGVAIASGAVYERLGPDVLFIGWALVMACAVGIAAWLGRGTLGIPVADPASETV